MSNDPDQSFVDMLMSDEYKPQDCPPATWPAEYAPHIGEAA